MKTRIIAVWLYTVGCFNLVFHAVCADLFQQEEHGRRVKRFLFNKVNEPNITYGPVTLCCECDDFDESNSCHKNCRTGSGYGSMKPCMGQLCSTTATLINDRFYIVSGCASEKICQDERNVYDQTKGCQTMLKEEMSNGTKCGYCCRDPDLIVHGTSHNSDCLNNLDKLVSHAYSQNIMASTTTTTAATTTKAAAATTTTSTTLTSEKSTTTDAIYKTASTESLSSKEVEQICKARTDSKEYFPYPGDETKFIQCGDFGAYTILHCPHKTVWFDEAETCNFGHNHITRQVSTKAVTSLLKTTLQRNSELTAFSRDTITAPSPGALTTSSGALTTSSGALTASSGVTCHTCTDDKHCRIELCQLTDAYCLNVVQVYANGSQTVAKKSCASFYECQFDHSLRSSQCDTTKQSSNVSISNKAVLCQYCCKASDSTSPCNIHNIPDKIDWFQVFHAACADLFQQEEHGRRVKRFLFNKVNEPNIAYGPVTLCCECDDFDESNSCHKNCRTGSGYGSMKPCTGQLCSTTATLINDRFYIVSGCASEKICQDERNVYALTKGCQTMLKEEMSNGTKCGYCCRDPDLTVHGTSHNTDCLNNLDKLVSHAYNQNIMASSSSTTATTTAAAATTTTTTSTTLASEKYTTTDAIYKTASTGSLSSKEVEQICKARTESKKYFPYPGDEAKYIQCDDFGAYTIWHCPNKTVWFDEAETCNFGHNHITRHVSTKAVTSLLKTTLKRSSELTAFSRDTITTTSSGALTTSSEALTSSVALTVSSGSNAINTTSTLASIMGHTGVTCHTCTDDKNCRIEPCQSTDVYCLNVVRVYANGSQTVAKKSCASFYECKFDHSLRSSQCDTTNQSSNTSASNKAVLCQYCCKASDSSSPCNIHNIPDKIDWFQGSSQSVPQVSDNGTTIRFNATETPTSTRGNKTSLSQNIPVSSRPPLHSSVSMLHVNATEVHLSTLPNNMSTPLTKALLSTTATNTTITKLVSSTSPTPGQSVTSGTSIPQIINTTTTTATKKITKAAPYTIPPRTARCQVCSGPEFLCEKLFEERDCEAPNHYCVNTLINHLDGSRIVNRRCANFDTCYKDWFLGSSDSDKCRRFNEKQILTLDFTCTYCCVTDGCNLSINPPYDTLYTDT